MTNENTIFDQINDCRGLTVYSKKDGSSFIIEDLGGIPDDYTLIPKPLDGIYEYSETIKDWVLIKDTCNIPQVLEKYKAIIILKRTLYAENVSLYTHIDELLNSNKSTQENDELLDAWNYAPYFERYSPILLNMQKILNLTDEQVDLIFIMGAKVGTINDKGEPAYELNVN